MVIGEFESANQMELNKFIPIKLASDLISQIAKLPDITIKVNTDELEWHGKHRIFGISGTRSTAHMISGLIRVHFKAHTTQELDSKIDRIKEEMILRELVNSEVECKWMADKTKHPDSRLKGYISYPDTLSVRSALLQARTIYSYYIYKNGVCLNETRE